SPSTSSPTMVSGVPSTYARSRSAITGVLRRKTPSPSVLPTHTVCEFSGSLVLVGFAAGADVAAAGEAAAPRVAVGAALGDAAAVVTAGAAVGAAALNGPRPHPLRSRPAHMRPRSVAVRIMPWVLRVPSSAFGVRAGRRNPEPGTRNAEPRWARAACR